MWFGCGSDVVWTWFGCGSLDMVRMWFGRGLEVVRMWVGGGSDVSSDLVQRVRQKLRESGFQQRKPLRAAQVKFHTGIPSTVVAVFA